MENLDDYQVFIIRNPYYSLSGNKEAQSLYGLIQSLKAEWYLAAHQSKVLPFGVDEMISTHVLIKYKNIPVSIFKINTYKDCNEYKLEHPILNNIKNDISLYNAINEKIKSIYQNGRSVGYVGNLSRNPDPEYSLKRNPMFGKIIGFIFYKCSNLLNINEYVITGGITNNAYVFIEKLGFKKLTSKIIEVEALNYLPAYILHHENISTIKSGSVLEMVWSNRIEYVFNEITEEKHAA